jgi:hypothetical protein
MLERPIFVLGTHKSGTSLLRSLLDAREARAGPSPAALPVREWVPFVQTLRSRRRFGRSLWLDRQRLSECKLTPTLFEDACALPFQYASCRTFAS